MGKITLIFIASLCLIALAACSQNTSNGESTIYYSGESFFTFDEQQGATAYNSRANEFHGTIFGASRTEGKVNNALYFANNLPSYI